MEQILVLLTNRAWEGWIRVVGEPPTAPQGSVPPNVRTSLLCVPPFICTHQPATGTKDICHIPRATDPTPGPRGGTPKAYCHRQEHLSATTPLSEITEKDAFLSRSPSQGSALGETGLTVHSIPVGRGQGFAYMHVWEPVCLMPLEAEDIITLELDYRQA